MAKKINKKNFNKVLDTIKKNAAEDSWLMDQYIQQLNPMLDDMLGNDTFGTEGQNDPRGDHRD